MRRALYAFLILLAGGLAFVRLAPDDPARWNREANGLAELHWQPGQDLGPLVPGRVRQTANSARIVAKLGATRGADFLTRLDRVALATPRTRRLAGTPDTGLMTWVTRSPVFGFPDYTTAQVVEDGPNVAVSIFARARYGRGDMGVNAARLRDWIARLTLD